MAEEVFDTVLQAKVLSLMLKDKNFMSRTWHLIKPLYFDSDVLVDLCRVIVQHFEKYSALMSISALIAEAGLLSEGHVQKAAEIYRDALVEREYIKDKVITFIRYQEYRNATEKTIMSLESGDLGDVKRVWDNAFKVGDGHKPGLFFFDPEEMNKRWQPEDDTTRRPTGFPELDCIIEGGLGKGELGIVLAPPGVGKSKALVQFGCGALKVRKKVAHFSMEMSQKKVALRYDRNLLGRTMTGIRDDMQGAEDFLVQLARNLKSNLYIKDWPTRTATIDTLKAEMDYLASQDFYPDLVVVDYGGIMKPRYARDGRHQEIEEINEELRGWAAELPAAMWSAAQTKSTAVNKAIVDIDDFGESFAQSKVADLILAYCQTAKEYEDNEMRWFIAKQREEKKHQILRYATNDSLMRMTFIGEN